MWNPVAGRDDFGVNLISSLKLKMTGSLPPCLPPAQLGQACLARGRADGAWYVNRQLQGSLAQSISPRSKESVKTQFLLVCTPAAQTISMKIFRTSESLTAPTGGLQGKETTLWEFHSAHSTESQHDQYNLGQLMQCKQLTHQTK